MFPATFLESITTEKPLAAGGWQESFWTWHGQEKQAA
jgi:hypothetical protein